MKYDVQEYLKARGLTGISDEQIEQHWQLYGAYVKDTNELFEEIETAEHGSRVWGGLKRRLGFEFNGMVLHEYYFTNLAAGAALSPGERARGGAGRGMGSHTGVARGLRPDGRDARRRLGDPLRRPAGRAADQLAGERP